MPYVRPRYKNSHLELGCGLLTAAIFAGSSAHSFWVGNYRTGAIVACFALGMVYAAFWLNRAEGERIRQMNAKLQELDDRDNG